MSFVWTFAEARDGKLKQVSFELLARARKLADQLDTQTASVLIGSGVSDDVLQELIWRGADNVYFVDDPRLAEFTNETYSNVLADLIAEWAPHTVLAAATTTGRTVMPYVAIKVNTGLTADCTELSIDPDTKKLLQTRPAIGGNIMATIKTPDHMPQMATVRPKSARPLPIDKARVGKIQRVALKDHLVDERAQVLGFRSDDGDFENIEEAEYIVAGGKGLKKAENFKLLRELSALFGGAVGASRDAVDRGWISYPHQIGLSGKTVSPKLYICAGVSGSIQHLAGIKTSEYIVAINTDPDARILSVADYGIVGDLFQIVPRLTERLKEEMSPAKAAKTVGAE